MPRGHPLSTLRLKLSKTTVLVPVNDSTKLSELRATLLQALQATASSAGPDDPDLEANLPASADDIALWRQEPSAAAAAKEADGDEEERWIELKDEKSGAAKWAVSEAEEIGVSFKAADGTFPEPRIVRPVDDDDDADPAPAA